MEAKSQFPFQRMVHQSDHFLLMQEIVPVCGPLPLPPALLPTRTCTCTVGASCSYVLSSLLCTCLSNKLFTGALASAFLNMVTCWNSIGIIVIRCTLYITVGSAKDSWWLQVLNMLLVKLCINDLLRVCVSTVPVLLVLAIEVSWGLWHKWGLHHYQNVDLSRLVYTSWGRNGGNVLQESSFCQGFWQDKHLCSRDWNCLKLNALLEME